MAVRYPLIVDTEDSNQIKEIQSGDSLNLQDNNIVNVVNITASGTLTVSALVVDTNSLTVGGSSLNTVALTGNYSDLSGTPTLFDGQYSSLTGRPTIPRSIEDLANVGSTSPSNGQALVYDSILGRYEPADIASLSIDLTTSSIDDLSDVVLTSAVSPQVLKFNGIAFVNEQVDWSEITNKPTFTGNTLNGDLVGSVFADDSSTIVDGINSKVSATLVATAGTAPTLSGDPGDVGEIRFDDNYIYIKTSGTGWKRAALSGL